MDTREVNREKMGRKRLSKPSSMVGNLNFRQKAVKRKLPLWRAGDIEK